MDKQIWQLIASNNIFKTITELPQEPQVHQYQQKDLKCVVPIH